MSKAQGGSGHPKQFYVAIGTLEMKLPTLVDLLRALSAQDPSLAVLIVCNSRDTLDELVRSLAELERTIDYLHADLCNDARRDALGRFASSESNVLVCTDVCLPREASGEAPTAAQLLVNYDTPGRRDQHGRRVACLAGGTALSSSSGSGSGGGGLIINFVAAGEVSSLKSLETMAGTRIEELPLNLSECFEGLRAA